MTSTTDAVRGSRPPTALLKGSSLFLDFDGTLVDIAPRPDAVRVSAELRDLLERLRDRLGGRLAILTGRSAAEVERLLDPLSLAIGGHHGLETRNIGTSTSIDRPAVLDEIVKDLRRLERQHPGVLLEDKPLGIALHYREAPDAEESCRAAVEQAAERSGLEVQPGKMVFELRPGGANKGDALRRLLEAPLFAGSRPIFLGDDLTDEPAFTAAHELGGAGILIGERESTAAFYRLDSVAEALAWLEDACEAAQ
jgi:trehalose 6-phosphate phosphatase